jgi:hypothetical protein
MRDKSRDVGWRATQSPAGRQQLKFFSDDSAQLGFEFSLRHGPSSWRRAAHRRL